MGTVTPCALIAMTPFADIRTLNTRQGLADTPIGGIGLFGILRDGVEKLHNDGQKEGKKEANGEAKEGKEKEKRAAEQQKSRGGEKSKERRKQTSDLQLRRQTFRG